MEIRIGSFNMNNFGGSSNKDFGKIAEIIVEENLDVVALQEIFSEGRGVSRLLEQNVKYELYIGTIALPRRLNPAISPKWKIWS